MSSSFGQRLRAFRKNAGLTQEDLADILNLSYMTVRRWESGKSNPRIEEVKKIAEALHVSENDLLYDNQTNNNNQWVLQIRIAHSFNQEVFDMTKNVPRQSSILTTPDGAFLCLGGNYDLWTDDNNFKKFIADLKKFRATVIQNGIALGGIKQ